MENLEALTNRTLRAYELGRLRMAARVALLLLPIVVFCLLEPVGRKECACCGALLLAAAIWFRFRSRAGVDSVTTGLLAGGVPLAAGLTLAEFDAACATAGPLSYCSAFSILIGGAAGTIVALREASLRERSKTWLWASVIAALAASLGCVRLGVASVVAVSFGIVVGRAMTSVSARPV